MYTLWPSARVSAAGSDTGSWSRVSRIESRSRTRFVSLWTTVSTCSGASPSRARTRRSASARTCQVCHVDRRDCMASRISRDVSRTHFWLTRAGAPAAAVPTERATMLLMASSLPRTSRACPRHSTRCSCKVRGSCLASRVSRVACWASLIDSTGEGGRPCVVWNSRASSALRVWMLARRADHRSFRRGSTPTISRTGRLRGSELARSAKQTPRSRVRCRSSDVL